MEFGPGFLLPARNSQPLLQAYLVDVYLVYGVILCGAAVILRAFAAVLWSCFQVPELEASALSTSGDSNGVGVATAQQTPSAGGGGFGKEKAA